MTDTLGLDARLDDTFSPAPSFVDHAAEMAVDHTPVAVAAAAAVEHVELTPPVDVEPKLPNGFIAMNLAPELLSAVKEMGYNQPTPVQARTIPLALPKDGPVAHQYTDLMVSSQTGSGKTAAFLLPVLHTLLHEQQLEAEAEAKAWEAKLAEAAAKGEAPPKRAKRKNPADPRHFKAATPGALVLCPTRELAQQVAHDAIELVRHCKGLRIANIVGGMPYALQIAKLQNADLVVATPGRLLDLQRSMQIKLDKVQFLVVDEADRMLDLGFSEDLAEINQLTITRRQTMMFSATFAPRIQQLAARVMREPQRIQIDSPQEKHANIKQVLFWADNAQHKRKLLDHWLRDTSIDQAIVFASTQIECDGLAGDLQQEGFSAVALHGALSQGLRNRRLMALRQGQVQILVATDVAARGIDVPTITHVFNFGLPMKSEDYTHRIGRTGRAGRDGLAVTIAEFRDRRKIFDIEAYTRQPLKAETIPGLEPTQRLERPRPPMGAGRGGDRFGGRPNGGFGRPAPRGNFGGGRFDREARFEGRGGDPRFADRAPADRGSFGGDRGFAGHDRGGFQGGERGQGGDRGFGADRGFGGGDQGRGFGGDRHGPASEPRANVWGGGGGVDYAKKTPFRDRAGAPPAGGRPHPFGDRPAGKTFTPRGEFAKKASTKRR